MRTQGGAAILGRSRVDRRSSFALVIAVTLLPACVSGEGARPPAADALDRPQPSQRSPQPAPTPHPGPSPANQPTVAWRWDDAAPDNGLYHAPITIDDPGGMRCVFTFEDAASRERLECADRDRRPRRSWSYQIAGASSSDASLAQSGDTLYVASIDNGVSGCEVRAYAVATGEERWRRRLVGVGPVDHSAYRNDIQLRIVDGRPVVFGSEVAGRYIEVLDRLSGAILSNRMSIDGWRTWRAGTIPPPEPQAQGPDARVPTPGAAAGIEWRWAGSPSVRVSGAGLTCKFEHDTTTATARLGCDDRAGRPVWWYQNGGQMMAGAALAIGGSTLYVAHYHPMASGAWVGAHDLQTGAERWRAGVHGLGPVAHSIYQNEVHVAADSARVILLGREMAGQYIEVLDGRTGRTLGNRRVP